MSQNHITKGRDKVLKNSSANGLENTICCTPVPCIDTQILSTKSDGSIKQQEFGLKQKLVNKVKSWSSKDKLIRNENATSSKIDPETAAITCSLKSLELSCTSSEDNMFRSKISNARDSLEHISISKTKFSINDDTKLSLPKDVDVAHSDCTFKTSKTMDSPKLAWDPWNKLGRKNKRENKKRKEKSPHTSREITDSLSTKKPKGCVAGDELHVDVKRCDKVCEDPYEYQPYNKTRKYVNFVNQVEVIYFTSDEIISKESEPLKKESDQHLRNKEMRKGHIPCTLIGKKQLANDYMSGWFKK